MDTDGRLGGEGSRLLRPEAFLDVELDVRMPPAMTVPSDAVFDSARGKTLFVAPQRQLRGPERRNRMAPPRPTSLLNAESPMRAASAGILNGDIHAVCGMEVDTKKVAAAERRREVPASVDVNDRSWQQVLLVKPGVTDPTTRRPPNEERLLGAVEGDPESSTGSVNLRRHHR